MTKTMRKKAPRAAVKPKRARTAKGRFVADDPSTPHINEAYVQDKKYTFVDYVFAAVIIGVIVAGFYYS